MICRHHASFHPGLMMRTWLYIVIAVFCLSGAASRGQTSDPDLASPSANIELIEAGSLIIPMDNNLQNAGLAYFNLRAYGLPHRLLQADVPVKWAIRSGKGKDGIDFTAYAQRILPTAGGASNFSFRAGPFIVLSCFTNSAASLIHTYATQQNVAVYRVLSNFYCDVRYTLRHKPRVAILDDGGTEGIHIDALAAARIPTNDYIHLNATGMLALAENSCYTLCVAPHYLPRDSSEIALHSAVSAQVAAVRAFLNGGGNLFAQCASVGTYENQASVGKFLTTNGIAKNNVNYLFLQYANGDTPLNQYQGDLNGSQGGSLTDFQLLTGSALRSNTYIIARNVGLPNLYVAAAGKLVRNKRGSFIGYLGGHDYNAVTTQSQINGRRIFLNALFVPTLRPRVCELNFGSDLYVTKVASTNIVYNGDPLTYTIVVSNNGPYTAIAATISDYFPPEFTNISWTMTASPGCIPTNASGFGNIVQEVTIPEFGAVTFVADGNVDATLCDPFDASCGVLNEARATWEACYGDIEPSNNVGRANITVFRSVISGQVRHDRDGNGDLNDLESGIPGVPIELWSDPNQDGSSLDGALVLTTTTDALGRYSFTELLPGYYVVKQLPITGFDPTGDADGGADSEIAIALPVGLYMLNMDFLLQAQYDLVISKRVNKEEDVDPGETLTYSISVFNAGLANQTNVTVVDTLPDTMVYETGSTWILGYNGITFDSAVDRFYSRSFTNSNGNIPWRTAWLEQGESDGALNGAIIVTQTVGDVVVSNRLLSVRDTHIRKSAPSSNYGTATEMLIRTGASTEDRALIYFDLSSINPAFSVTQAIMQVRVSKAQTTAIEVYAMATNWTEAGATWNNATSYFTNVIASFVPSVAAYTNVDITALVSNWVHNSVSNRGVTLIQTADKDSRIRPRESAGSEPALFIHQKSSAPDYALAFRSNTAQSVRRGLNLFDYTNGVLQFFYDLHTGDPEDFIAAEVSTNNINWTVLTNIYGQISGVATLSLPHVYTTNAWLRFRNEGYGSVTGELALIDDVNVIVQRKAIFSVPGSAPPVIADGYDLIPGGNLTISFQATLMGAPDIIENTACVYSDDYTNGTCDTVSSGLSIVLLTQGVVRVQDDWRANELRWQGPEVPLGESRFDMIYVDQNNKGFNTAVSNLWTLAQTITNETVFWDDGDVDIGRIAPTGLSHNVMRFYRLAKPNRWRTNQTVRSASERIYAFKNVLLKPGENFVSTFGVPDRNEVSYIFGTNALPSGDSLEEATRIEWYGATPNGAATNKIWLSNSGNWLFADGGLANDFAIPLHEGFNIVLPSTAPTQLLQMIYRLPDQLTAEDGHFVPLIANRRFNVVGYNLPNFVKLGESGLKTAGFKGISPGQPLNPLYSDELRILQRGGGSLAAPIVRILMNASGQFVYWTGGTRGASAEDYVINPDDVLIIYTVKSTNDWSWTPPMPYPPPTREMNP